jgi:hypothetical protein
MPTAVELEANIEICYGSYIAPPSKNPLPVLGFIMQVDEIKIQECLRWDPHTNMILGVCQEHGSQYALEF